MDSEPELNRRWYDGVTRYQWLVLIIASVGWSFDVFEGQLFAVFKTPAMADLLAVTEKDPAVDFFANVGFAAFLIGGTVGGLFFGMLADWVGRRQTMVWSILTYSAFTGLHYFAQDVWHIIILRFFVAMGVAGEWAIAASLVAEVFPKKARALAGGIFHASSVVGAVLAAGIGIFLTDKSDWRMAFLVGLVPALLVVWVLVSLKESEKWQVAKGGGLRELVRALLANVSRKALNLGGKLGFTLGLLWSVVIHIVRIWGAAKVGEAPTWSYALLIAMGLRTAQYALTGLVLCAVLGWLVHVLWKTHFSELLGVPQWRNRSLIGLGLASVGLGTYWAIYAFGPELVHEVLGQSVSADERRSAASFVYLIMNFTGGFAGLLAFAPITMFTNRRIAFAFYHIGALILVPITFLGAQTYTHTLILLPIMAFFVVGMHAGYAIYFPELFPTRLRATGSSFCFNVGRLVSAVMLLVRGELRQWIGLRYSVSLMSLLFLVGLIFLLFAPETKGRELPE